MATAFDIPSFGPVPSGPTNFSVGAFNGPFWQLINYVPAPPPFPSRLLVDANGDYRDDTDPRLITNHCALGGTRLLTQFSVQPDIRAILCVFLDQLQDLEQAYADIEYLRQVSIAVGVWLEWLASNAGETRQGLTDDELKRILAGVARITANNSTPNDALAALEVMVDAAYLVDVAYVPAYPAGAFLYFKVDAGQFLFGSRIVDVIRRARPLGVNVNHLWEEDVLIFGFDDEPGSGPFGESVTDPGAGTWAEAM